MNVQIDWVIAGEASLAITGILILARMLIRYDVGRGFPTRAEHAELAGKVDEMAGDFRKIEVQIAALPSQSEFTALGDRLGRVDSAVAHMQGTLDRVSSNVSLLLQNELQERK